ncbi:hypothetical protein JCM10213_000517 [Rhodosporidiobolus nylandii]
MAFPPTLRAPVFALCLLLAHAVHAVPLPAAPSPLVLYSGITASAPIPTTAPSPLPSPEPSTSTIVDYITVTATETETIASTATETETVESTVTETLFTSSTLPSPSSRASSRPASTASRSPAATTPAPSPIAWTAPSNFDNGDFSAALAVNKWAWGQSNVALVTGIPSSAWATSAAPSATAAPKGVNHAATKNLPRVDLTNSTMMEVSFPQGSINPGNKSLPTGGTGMYLTPVNLSTATNVTFSYSVFFPADFDFVKGGKLPGLYGGHPGCSGGAESEDCFSTRTMWRTDGKGELYLYAPRNVQPPALCQTKPVSYCDTTYGMSIGRGAWTFQRGAWTTVRQNLKLNTPGVADGAFEIYVNDALVLSSDAVVFRKNLAATSSSSSVSTSKETSSKPTPTPTPTTARASTSAQPKATTTASASGGLLDGLLNGLLGNGLSNVLLVGNSDSAAQPASTGVDVVSASASASADIPVFTPPSYGILPPVFPSAVEDSDTEAGDSSNAAADGSVLAAKESSSKAAPQNAGIDGVMYHAFFGGSDPSWATPRDQVVYFDRLSLVVNE